MVLTGSWTHLNSSVPTDVEGKRGVNRKWFRGDMTVTSYWLLSRSFAKRNPAHPAPRTTQRDLYLFWMTLPALALTAVHFLGRNTTDLSPTRWQYIIEVIFDCISFGNYVVASKSSACKCRSLMILWGSGIFRQLSHDLCGRRPLSLSADDETFSEHYYVNRPRNLSIVTGLF